uniref:Uncharacterized protein n=1 Tax=Panagrolaimus sp. PS1159 TaxID=55785 RepID=A0AC35F2T7_9BILA
AEKLPPNFWKHFDRTLERNEGYARNTYNVAKELQQFNADSNRPSSISFYLPQGSSIQSLVKPSRLVIWSSHDPTSLSNPVIKVKETGPTAAPTTTWRRFMSANFTTIVVFSDSIALIQKGDFIIIEMPLIWMNSVSSMNNEMEIDSALITEETSELMVQILAPEYEFHVEFPNVEMKNHLLSAFSASFRLHRERTELTVFDDQLGTSIHVLPQTRYGIYDYSSTHYMYKNCRYEGFWKSGIPHGIGTITYFDGREYKGRFINGNIHGFGEMKIPEEQKEPSPLMSSVFFTEFPAKKTNKFHHYKGKWKNGKLHGLSFIQYANGDTYEGYCIGGQPHGHGVYRSMDYNGGQQVYVGGWHGGVKHGYGVLSLNKERYLGMWKDDLRHDKGCQITIDGVFHEGIFDRNRFTKGRIVYQTNENDTPASYEGEFEKIGVAAGKGILRLTPADQIEGIIHGTVLSGELKITNATYTRKDIRQAFHISLADLQIVDEGPVESQWAVTADIKWQELFDQFLLDELGFGEAGKSDEELCKRAWERLSSGLEKIKIQKNISIDERLERVPNVYDEWSLNYYSTVCEFWNLCLSTPHHPINRLINGLVEIFCCSYNNIGTHAIMYDSAVLEFTSLIQRAYRVMRYLFPHLPSVSSMYQSIPINSNPTQTGQEDGSSISSLEEKDNTSVKSTSSKPSSGQGSVGPSSDDFTVATPCCDFIIHHFFGQCYAELFTMYSVKCNEMDRRYWERVMFLNTATDARLLSYLGVEKGLWPMDTENTSDLDKFMVRVTARKKFYETAIHTLQRLSCEFNPSSKLSILAETFSEISAVGFCFFFALI